MIMAGKPKVTSIARTFDQHWKLNPDTGCHEWQRGKRREYGVLYDPERGEVVGAHVFSFERANGPVPDGLHVCHRCDNPPCVNPDHLFAGTNTQNRHDSVSKARHARGDGHGRGRLTSADVIRIRELAASGEVSDADLATQFGIRQQQISKIVTGARWRHLPGAISNRPKPAARGERNCKAKLSREQVAEIRAICRERTLAPKEIAAKYGISKATVWRVGSGNGWQA